jgi:hypothetical protein
MGRPFRSQLSGGLEECRQEVEEVIDRGDHLVA